ncbi:MAG: Maf family protein [SAR324 cluster bacterium]|nr:Maf family protein [SAR324 cluster bacterium]
MKFTQSCPLILASGSPRRKEYFERYGFDFEILKADIPEEPKPNEKPEAFALRLAREKGAAVREKCAHDFNGLIISADTIVVLGDEIIGKPRGKDDVLPMLQKLAGQTHQVITAYAILGNGVDVVKAVTTNVEFYPAMLPLLLAYSKTIEPLDKAGSYSIQGVGSFMVKSIEGSYNNVVGLPIEHLLQDLSKFKAISI